MRRDLAGVISSDENLNQELRVNAEDLLKKPVRQREKRRGSRRFTRFLVAICIGVVGTLAWQSYGEAIKQTIAIRAPEFGWSPESKHKWSRVRQKKWPERHIQADEQHLQLCHRQSRHCALWPMSFMGVQHGGHNTEDYNSDEVEAMARQVASETHQFTSVISLTEPCGIGAAY
jgi:hypothetical protein